MLTALVDGPLRERAAGESLVRRVMQDHRADRVADRGGAAAALREWAARAAADRGDDPGGAGPDRAAPVGARRVARRAPTRRSTRPSRRSCDVLGAGRVQHRRPRAGAGRRRAARRSADCGSRVAESCTGGLITSRLTDVPGSSRYVDAVGRRPTRTRRRPSCSACRPTLIAEHGAVSEPVALAMADGMRARAGVDVGVGVTGIAGPGGGTPEKPVGTVAIAAVTARRRASRMFRFHRRARAGEVSGVAGGARHGAAHADAT